MVETHDKTFYQQRSEAFDKVIALAEGRVKAATPAVLIRFHEM